MRASKGTLALAVACAAAVVATSAGCLDRRLAPVDPVTQSGVFVEIRQTGTTRLDLLFVVDNSNSMTEEQAVLADQIEVMARELAHPSARPDGTTPPAVEDLHIGIVTSDMGSGGYSVTTCDNPIEGDNGVLQSTGRLEGCAASYSAPGCARASCPWLVHSEEHPDDGADPGDPPLWEDFACIATLGTGGCGFEQQLESSLVALTTQAEPGRPNDGFLRDDSLVAIVYVTDEDDCSAANPEIFNPSRNDLGPPNTRCAIGGRGLLHPVSRYYEGFLALRPGAEDLVVVAAIAGLPIDGSWQLGDPIEDLEAMVQIDPARPNDLLPSCSTTMGLAFPPVRIAELVTMFGENGILESVCRSDWTAALVAITRKIQARIPGRCMTRELESTDPDVCRVIETLVDDRPCPSPAVGEGADRTGWQVDLGLDEDGRRQCEVLPADLDGDGCADGARDCATRDFEGGLMGWVYDRSDPECDAGQVLFTSPDVTSDRSRIRFECRTALCPARRQCGEAAQNVESCDPSDEGSCGAGRICVRHNSEAICGGEGSCGRCSEAVSAVCPAMADANEYWAAEPLVEAGGCCHEGFHCEAGACQPNRTTSCE